MAKLVCKNTVLKQTISNVLTAVAQLISIDLPEHESESVETRTLDGGVGIPHDLTGYTEGGSLKAELYFDPALTGHRAILALLTAPVKCVWNVVFSDATIWPFTSSGVKFGGTVDAGDCLKGTVELKLDGIVTFPSS